jgi:hypothetical protein
MHDLVQSLSNSNSPFAMIIVLGTLGILAGVVTTIVKEARKFACHRADAILKRDLVERGLSVDEIERILAAKSGPKAVQG